MKNEKKKWKKRKLWHVNVHMGTDTHLPSTHPGESSIPYLQCIIGKGYTAMYRQALYVISCVWTRSADFPECGDSVFHAGSLCYNKEKINQVWSLLVLYISKCTCPTRFISIMFTLSNLQIETLGSGGSNIIWLYLNVLICNTTLTLSSLCLFSWWLSLPAFPGAFSLPNY